MTKRPYMGTGTNKQKIRETWLSFIKFIQTKGHYFFKQSCKCRLSCLYKIKMTNIAPFQSIKSKMSAKSILDLIDSFCSLSNERKIAFSTLSIRADTGAMRGIYARFFGFRFRSYMILNHIFCVLPS